MEEVPSKREEEKKTSPAAPPVIGVGFGESPPEKKEEIKEVSPGERLLSSEPAFETVSPEEKLERTREEFARFDYDLKKLYREKATPEYIRELEDRHQEARGAYFEAERANLRDKSKAVEAELDQKVKAGEISLETRDAELSKIASLEIFSEFKKFYDQKTEIEDQRKKESVYSLLGKASYRAADSYRRMSFKKKLLISGTLLGAGMAAGALTGGTGLALATLVGGGRLGQRFLSAGATSIALEAFLKKKHERTREEEWGKRSQEIAAHFEKSFADYAQENPAAGLSEFLRARDTSLEQRLGMKEEEMRKFEKRLTYRRYLLSGAAGLLIASGATAKAFGALAGMVSPKAESLIGGVIPLETPPSPISEVPPHPLETTPSPEESLPLPESEDLLYTPAEPPEPRLYTPETPPSPESRIFPLTPENLPGETDPVATVKAGGGIWQAARSFVAEGKISAEEFQEAWDNSTVEVRGVKVPVSEVGLSHVGDQVIYVKDAGGGHFEVIDYAKDKFGLGTNNDLYETYGKLGKKAPPWLKEEVAPPEKVLLEGTPPLEEKVAEPIHEAGAPEIPPQASPQGEISPPHAEEALKETSPAVEAPRGEGEGAGIMGEAENYLNRHSLHEQEEMIEKMKEKIAGGSAPPYLKDLLAYVESHPLHLEAEKEYGRFWGSAGLTPEEFSRIKDIRVGKFLRHYGRSLFEYFPDDPEVGAHEISHRRNLAALLRTLRVGGFMRIHTVEKFLKLASYAAVHKVAP